jgi:peptidoglycan/LPS O-acetylase OafA/YrhL
MRSNVADPLSPGANNLSLMRLVAAVCIVWWQCAVLLTGSNLSSGNLYNLADHAYHLFFIVSGLTVAASLARSRSPADFIAGRFLRIWPPLIAVTTVVVFVVAPVFSTTAPVAYFADPTWKAMIAKTLVLSGSDSRLPGMFESNPAPFIVNGGPWTLGYVVVCYVVLMAGSLASARRGAFARAAWLPGLTIFAAAIMIAAPASAATIFARFFFAFGLGAIAYQYRGTSTSWAAAVALVAGVGYWCSIGYRIENIASIVFVAAATVFLARVPMGAARRIANRFDISYGLCLVSWPVTQIVLTWATDLSAVALFVVVLPTSACLAFILRVVVERPALALRRWFVACLERLCAGSRLTAAAFVPAKPTRR